MNDPSPSPRPIFNSPFTDERLTLKDAQLRLGLPTRALPNVPPAEAIANCLDHAEASGHNRIDITIRLVAGTSLTIMCPQGTGLSRATLEQIVFDPSYTSSNRKFRSPTRGAQGRGFLDVLTLPVALNNEIFPKAPATISSQGQQHTVHLQRGTLPTITSTSSDWGSGTKTTVYFPTGMIKIATLTQQVKAFALTNPHVHFTVMYDQDIVAEFLPNAEAAPLVCKKYRSGEPTNALYYTAEEFSQLIDAYCATEAPPTLNQFLMQFEGIGPQAAAQIIRTVDTTELKEFRFNAAAAKKLHKALTARSRYTKMRGQVAADHIRTLWDAPEEKFQFKRDLKIDGWMIECAFTFDLPEQEGFTASINHAPTYEDPTGKMWVKPHGAGNHSWSEMMGVQAWVEGLMLPYTDSRWGLYLHLVTPAPQFTQSSKSRLDIPYDVQEVITLLVGSVTKDAINARIRRQHSLKPKSSTTITKIYASMETLQEAYEHAGGTDSPTPARMVAYSIRRLVQDRYPNLTLDSMATLTQDHIPKYQRCAKAKAKAAAQGYVWTLQCQEASGCQNEPDWWEFIVPSATPLPNIVWEARGVLVEPHTGNSTALGTKEVADYHRPEHLFDKVLVIEKTGFRPLLDAARIAEQRDCAIVYSQGQGTTANRDLLAGIATTGAEVAALYDADPYGFAQVRALQEPTERMPEHSIAGVHHIGLRLDEAIALGLLDEYAPIDKKKGLPRTIEPMLSATERDWWCYDEDSPTTYRRIELNSFTATQLIDFINQKLDALGWVKLVPPEEAIEQEAKAKQRALTSQALKEEILARYDIEQMITDLLQAADLSTPTEEEIREGFEEEPEDSWRDIVEDLVQAQVDGLQEQIQASVESHLEP